MMKTNQRKPLIGIVGIIFLMMTAASVSAADSVQRGTLPQGDSGTVTPVDSEGNALPVLIATEDSANNSTLDIPDYGNYSGDMLISPGPLANADASTPFSVPILGVIAVAVIGLIGVGLLVARRQKK
jgi:hypothetical protein